MTMSLFTLINKIIGFTIKPSCCQIESINTEIFRSKIFSIIKFQYLVIYGNFLLKLDSDLIPGIKPEYPADATFFGSTYFFVKNSYFYR